MISTAADLIHARHELGWSQTVMASALRLGDWRDRPEANDRGKRRLYQMESDRRPISGSVAVAVESFLAGFRPEHIDWESIT